MDKALLKRRLDRIFAPETLAVIGASTTLAKWGQLITSNIIAGGFPGTVHPVNPGGRPLFGRPSFPDIGQIPGPVDLVFVTTPVETTPGILEACGHKGVLGVVMITSGFGETGASGKALEGQVVEICKKRGLALIGPNTMGIIAPHAGLFATGTHARPRPGEVAFVSQSGNMGNQLIHWAKEQGIGISLFVGSGNEAMIGCTDYLEYLEGHPLTRIILLYMENIGEGRRFLEVAKRVHLKKPIILLKGGRTQAGAKAAASHTGSMSGRDLLFRAACRQAGLLTVKVPSELLALSAGFSSLPLPRGNRVGIVTLGGGWGVVTADACNEQGLQVPLLPGSIVETIGKYLPAFWSRDNPVDLVGSRNLEAPLVAIEELLKWDGIDAVISLGTVGRYEFLLALLESARLADPEHSPEALERTRLLGLSYEQTFIETVTGFMERYEKPVIGVSMARTDRGTVRPVPGRRYAGVFYETPEDAVTVLASMVAYGRHVEKGP